MTARAPFPEHDRRVAEIAARLRELAEAGEPVHIAKGGVHHVVPLPGDLRFKTRPVDVSSLRVSANSGDADRTPTLKRTAVTRWRMTGLNPL